MPLFFFDVQGDRGDDREPCEFPDVQAARSEAITATGEILKDIDGKLVGKSWAMDVVDENGRSVLTINIVADTHGSD